MHEIKWMPHFKSVLQIAVIRQKYVGAVIILIFVILKSLEFENI